MRAKTASQPRQKPNAFGITFGDTAYCVETLRHSKHRWVSNCSVIVTRASEVTAKFLNELAECLGIQDDPIALSIDDVPLYFNHAKIVSLSRIQGSTMPESEQLQLYSVENGEIIDMPGDTIVVFLLQ